MYYKESIYNNYTITDGKVEVYNSLSKARITIEHKNMIIDILKKQDNITEPSHFKILQKNGFIVKDDIDEYYIVKYMFFKYYFTSHMKNIVLMPTLKCNFGCKYCFEKSKVDKFNESTEYFSAIKSYIARE